MKMVFSFFILAVSLSAFAQSSSEVLESIEVLDHSSGQGLIDYVPAAKTLGESDIRKKIRPTIAETIGNEAGVTSTQYGPNASRPVLRGLDGARVRFLQNSLQLLDASTQSVDHAIPVDPLIVDQIEIVRGPMGVLYGSSAVGGVVNIVTNRIHSTFEPGKVIELQSQAETVNNGLSNSVRMDYGKDQWMFHADASTRNLQNQEVPGYANEDEKKNKGEIQNSQNRQDSVGTGITRFFNRGMVGLAFNHFKNDYGIIAIEDESPVTIGMEQNRLELHSEYRPEVGPFHKLRFKSAQTDYRHREFEGGATGTFFKNIGNESRLEAMNETGNIKGTSGLQTDFFDFKAVGAEAFLPQAKNSVVALFTFQQLKLEKNIISAGARVETTSIKKESSEAFGGSDEFGFTGLNGSAGVTHRLSTANALTLNYSYTERAPTFQELLSNGAHVATSSFEIGNSQLTKEKANGFELTHKYDSGATMITSSVYAQYFKDYIALNPTGEISDDLPVFEYEQVDAVIFGLDVDAKHRLLQSESGTVNFLSKFDVVQGRDQDNNINLPRLSPPRLGAGLEHLRGNWESEFDVQHVFDQQLTAPNETRTSAYTLTNIGTQYSFVTSASKFDVFLRLRNIFDVEARSHVSFLKDVAPLPGRNIILGVHWLL